MTPTEESTNSSSKRLLPARTSTRSGGARIGNPRIVTYGSSQLPGDLPSSFEFTSRCIFAANVVPKKNDAFKAVLTRCDLFELSATNEEVIDLMRSISANGFNRLTPDDCQMVTPGHDGRTTLQNLLFGPHRSLGSYLHRQIPFRFRKIAGAGFLTGAGDSLRARK